MSLFNQFVYRLLLTELSTYILSLFVLKYLPMHMKKVIIIKIKSLVKYNTVIWIYRIVILLVFSVIFDSLTKIRKLNVDSRKEVDAVYGNTVDLLNLRVQRFYTQRNLYLSVFAMFMLIVLSNRFNQMYKSILLQEQIVDLKQKLAYFKEQNEKLTVKFAKDKTRSELSNNKASLDKKASTSPEKESREES